MDVARYPRAPFYSLPERSEGRSRLDDQLIIILQLEIDLFRRRRFNGVPCGINRVTAATIMITTSKPATSTSFTMSPSPFAGSVCALTMTVADAEAFFRHHFRAYAGRFEFRVARDLS
jgi:hypothetical protein